MATVTVGHPDASQEAQAEKTEPLFHSRVLARTQCAIVFADVRCVHMLGPLVSRHALVCVCVLVPRTSLLALSAIHSDGMMHCDRQMLTAWQPRIYVGCDRSTHVILKRWYASVPHMSLLALSTVHNGMMHCDRQVLAARQPPIGATPAHWPLGGLCVCEDHVCVSEGCWEVWASLVSNAFVT